MKSLSLAYQSGDPKFMQMGDAIVYAGPIDYANTNKEELPTDTSYNPLL